MFNEELGVFIGIPSKSRPFRVKEQEKLMGCKPTWFVPREEVKQYEDEGAITFPCDEIGLPQQRNYALEEAFKNNQTAVLLDDDLIGFNFIYHDKTLKPLTFVETVQAMKREVNIFKLAGNSSGTNLFWYDPKRPTSKKSPVGGIFLIKPSEPRYDPALRYNEDMDFSIQHYVKYGGLIKINYIQNKFFEATIDMETKKVKKPLEGGIDYNDDDFENAFNHLLNKWGNRIRRSKTKYEVIMR